ncbi:MAG TPA: hypothetical protein VKB76_19670, partial [Ktedonobacterales bacterium]|nr:hypothetical protein [Ktedonobacterales bacterium]
MSVSSPITAHQANLIKTAAGIIHVIDDNAMHPALQQTTPLSQEQISTLGHRFTDGLDHWDREVRSHRAPGIVEINRIAIVSELLNQKYPTQVRRDDRGEITIPVSDIVDAWRNLSGDLARFDATRAEWENRVLSLFGPDTASNTTPGRIDQATHGAQRVGLLIARSIGIDGLFNNVFEAGQAVEEPVPPLPSYAANDPRSKEPQLMAKLALELSVTEGLLKAITPDEPHENQEQQLLQWFKKRADAAIGTVTKLVIPSGIARYSAQLKDSQKVLSDSRKILRTCLYGTEPELASLAAQHAVERNVGTILFLSIFPNIPLLIPTIELRLIFTKPIMFLTKSAHDAMGDIPIFGFPFYLMMLMGRVIDAIPHAQIVFVQNLV